MKSKNKEISAAMKRLIDSLNRDSIVETARAGSAETGVKVENRPSVTDVIEERKKIENRALAQDIDLKKQTLFILFGFLAIETILIFIFTFFQGVHLWGFSLEEWSFKLLIAATITQVTLMVHVAVKHLFPQQTESASSSGSVN
jgi:hypothetical protein